MATAATRLIIGPDLDERTSRAERHPGPEVRIGTLVPAPERRLLGSVFLRHIIKIEALGGPEAPRNPGQDYQAGTLVRHPGAHPGTFLYVPSQTRLAQVAKLVEWMDCLRRRKLRHLPPPTTHRRHSRPRRQPSIEKKILVKLVDCGWM